MTAPDVRTAAQAEADKLYPLLNELGVPTISKSRRLRQKAFIKGAVWGAALVTPTREQIAKAMWEADPTPDRPWELAPEAVREAGYALAGAVLALFRQAESVTSR